MTFSAAASPPDVHQCSIWTSLVSAADAPDARPSAPAVIAPAIKIDRSFMDALPFRFPPPETARQPDLVAARRAANWSGDRHGRETSSPRQGLDGVAAGFPAL